MLMELPDKWGECSRTIPLEGRPEAFAHWGDMIAVGLKSDVVLLDAITGIRTSVFSGNTGTVSSPVKNRSKRIEEYRKESKGRPS